MIATIGMQVELPPEELDIVPLTDITQRCGKMSIRNGSSLSMDPNGLIVSVGHPIQNVDYIARFKAHTQGTYVYKSRTRHVPETLHGRLSGTALCECARHVDEWCRVAKGGFDKIFIDISTWCPRDQYEYKHKVASCPELVINTDDEATITMWLERIESGFESIIIKPAVDLVHRRIQQPVTMSENFANLEVWNCETLKELVIMHFVPFTDTQFLNIRVPWFEIMMSTVSDNAVNQYFHKWVSGDLPKSQRFGICLNRPIDIPAVMKGLLVVRWDDEFQETMAEFVEAAPARARDVRYTVFRTVQNPEGVAEEDKECSNATVYFVADQSIYLEITKQNWKFETALNQTQREKAKISP